MERSLLYRILLYLGITIAAVAVLTPSVASWTDKESKLPGWFRSAFTRKIQFGLDLQGGLHIVYRVDVDKALANKTDRLATDLEDRLKSDAKLGSRDVKISRTGGDEIRVEFINHDDAKKLNRQLLKPLKDLEVDSNKNGVAILKLKKDVVDETRDYALSQGVKTIDQRVDKLGVSEHSTVRKGQDIIVELPGLKIEDTDRVKRLIGQTAQLEFKIDDDGSEYMTRKVLGLAQALRDKYPGLETQHEQWTQKDNGAPHSDVYVRAKDRKTIEKFFAELPAEDQVPSDHEIGYEEIVGHDEDGNPTQEKFWRSYYLNKRAQLTGEYIIDADVSTDPQTLRAEVNMTFDHHGADIFEQLSGQNVGRKMAIILDDVINSAPVLESKIGGGRCRITLGAGSAEVARQEAIDLVAVLKAGALPAPLSPKSETKVGATLGRDAVDKAKLSMVVGSVLVILFMLIYYRLSGLIADIAMVFNVLFLLAILASLNATLTLPGIAGVVLTVGMAVDANIIIYERIREELRAGKTARGAVEAGFNRAFWTVFDAHVTNVVAGIVLLSYGTGPIRGFAVTLIAGIVCNLFTSVWLSRVMFDVMVNRRKSATLSI